MIIQVNPRKVLLSETRRLFDWENSNGTFDFIFDGQFEAAETVGDEFGGYRGIPLYMFEAVGVDDTYGKCLSVWFVPQEWCDVIS